MPIYEYHCARCDHVTSELRSMATRDKPAPCEKCGCASKRVVSATPGIVKNPAVPRKTF